MDKYAITILSDEHPGETPYDLAMFFQRYVDSIHPPQLKILSVSVVESRDEE